MTKLLQVSVALAATACFGVAQGAICSATTPTPGAPTYLGCEGSFAGNINQNPGDKLDELAQLGSLFGGTWSYGGSATPSSFGAGPFDVSFASQSGVFVIGVKAGRTYSYYEFDAGGVAISSVSFDTTAGIATNRRGIPHDLSHAELYVGPAPVPEPSPWIMMLAGLAGMGWAARRRG